MIQATTLVHLKHNIICSFLRKIYVRIREYIDLNLHNNILSTLLLFIPFPVHLHPSIHHTEEVSCVGGCIHAAQTTHIRLINSASLLKLPSPCTLMQHSHSCIIPFLFPRSTLLYLPAYCVTNPRHPLTAAQCYLLSLKSIWPMFPVSCKSWPP